MKAPAISWLLLLSGLGVLGQSGAARRTGPALRAVATIALPGAAGKRFDYLTIDYRRGQLWSAHLGANQTYVIDLKSNRLVKAISGTPGVEGLEVVPDLNKVYTSNWGDHTIRLVRS